MSQRTSSDTRSQWQHAAVRVHSRSSPSALRLRSALTAAPRCIFHGRCQCATMHRRPASVSEGTPLAPTRHQQGGERLAIFSPLIHGHASRESSANFEVRQAPPARRRLLGARAVVPLRRRGGEALRDRLRRAQARTLSSAQDQTRAAYIHRERDIDLPAAASLALLPALGRDGVCAPHTLPTASVGLLPAWRAAVRETECRRRVAWRPLRPARHHAGKPIELFAQCVHLRKRTRSFRTERTAHHQPQLMPFQQSAATLIEPTRASDYACSRLLYVRP